MNIKRLMDLGCYRGLRHRQGPSRSRAANAHERPDSKGPEAWHHEAEKALGVR